MKNNNDYFDSVTRRMMAFQYIEEAIKMVLMRLESLVYFRIKEFTSYDLKPKFASIRNSAMGRIIDMLNVYCDDNELITELKRIKKQRDIVAHQSLLMTSNQSKDKESIHLKSTELDKLNKEAGVLLQKLSGRWGELDNILNKITAESGSRGS